MYEQTHASGARAFSGVAYLSRLGDDFQNWAIFEPARRGEGGLRDFEVSRIEPDDPDLRRALGILGVELA